jgi:hypothetical protein
MAAMAQPALLPEQAAPAAQAVQVVQAAWLMAAV